MSDSNTPDNISPNDLPTLKGRPDGQFILYVPYSLIKRVSPKDAILISSAIAGLPISAIFTKSQISSTRRKYGIVLTPEEIRNIVSNRQGINECAWCRNKCFVLHKHHFPIPKRLGGDKIIKICSTCHSDYHWLKENKWFTNKGIASILKLPIKTRKSQRNK